MKNTRRSFIRKSASLASLSLFGNSSTEQLIPQPIKEYAEYGGQYFWLFY
ncbi:hypothetical protein [Dyadobacter sp. 3J3]|nr:hypothetical protein [Dyadobacter sp. 3J3]